MTQDSAAAERSAHVTRGGSVGGPDMCAVCGGPWAKGGASYAARFAPFRQVCSAACASLPPFASASADTIVAAVRADLAERSARGIAKYGVTLDRTDLSRADWLRHAYEEALDLALYLRRALRDAERAEVTGIEYRGG